MDIRGVDGGPTGAELSSRTRWANCPLKDHGPEGLPSLAQSGDTITAILSELSDPEVVRFLELLEQPPLPEMAARLDELIRASVSAVADGNVQQALAKLTEFAALNPRRAETLDAVPGLASIREEVGRLMFRMTSAAQLDAELRLGHATHLLPGRGAPGDIWSKRSPRDRHPDCGPPAGSRRLCQQHAFDGDISDADQSVCLCAHCGPTTLRRPEEYSCPFRACQPWLAESMDSAHKAVVAACSAPGHAFGVVCRGVFGRLRFCVAAE